MGNKNSGSRRGAPPYSLEIARTICEHIADGMGVKQISTLPGMPSPSLVYKWLANEDNATFRDLYARARERQADKIFEECLAIADSCENDVTIGPDGEEIVNHEAIARSKLRIDTRKWMAAKLRPRKYGDRVEIGGDAENPVSHVVRIERAIIDTDG